MNRNLRSVYCFIYDRNKHFYRATQSADGGWTVSANSQLFPLRHNPKNLKDTPVQFATNKTYFSMNRSINYPLDFIFDGAVILNNRYNNGKGFNEELYFAMVQFDPTDGKFRVSYNGRFDFQQKEHDEKTNVFSVPIIDDSAWGILSLNDDVEYSFDCNKYNPKAIKVLFDDFILRNRYTYQTVQSPIIHNTADNTYVVPFVLVNQDGDSSGLITKSQTYASTDNQSVIGAPSDTEYIHSNPDWALSTFYDLPGVRIQGSMQFTWSTNTQPSGQIYIFFRTSKGQFRVLFTNGAYPSFGDQYDLIPGKIYTFNFDFTIDLTAGENLFLLMQINDNAARNMTITFITTNVFISTQTTVQPTVCYGLRPLDVAKDLVNKATFGRYTINSDYFTTNNKTVLVPGQSLRGIDNAKLVTSFKDFFQSYDSQFFMALRNINGDIFMELADEVYDNQTSNLIDLGEIIECSTSPAIEYIPNAIEVGSPTQDYRHPSGRLEFNDTVKWALPFENIKNKKSWVSKYRTDCFGAIFMILDYNGQSTQDNSGDNDVWMIQITDEQGSAENDVSTFENININNATLAPIIKYPLTGDVINNDKPVIRGVGIPGNTVNIYIADVLDGGTTVNTDGTWEYQIVTSLPSYDPGVFDGISIINATYTTILGALDTIQLIINTTVTPAIEFTYPSTGDTLYNNLPLVTGVAPAGQNIDIYLDGILVDSVVTDNSCRFRYKFVTPITNANHTLRLGLTGDQVNFDVNSFTSLPLITYIEGELDGFIIVNNLPLIKGVGIPGTIFSLWLNYLPYAPLGTVTIDVNGDWSLQVVPINYVDPVTLSLVVLAPIRNGLSIISTQLINDVVQIAVTGYKLDRPLFTSITGVPDNTVFNTFLSPKRMMLRRGSMLASIMNKQRNDLITFQASDKNSNLATVLGGVSVIEREDIGFPVLGNPLAVLEIIKIKVVAKKLFAQTLHDFNNGGVVTGNFKGNDIFMLPIGSMSMKSIMDDKQEWNLLISPRTTYMQLLNLYKNGLIVNLMTNSIFHSDYNSLHFVTYDFSLPANYNFKELYDDYFDDRNDAWVQGKTGYIQKFQKTEAFRDQIITNGVSSLELNVYECKGGTLYNTIPYSVVSPAPIPLPEIVLEATIDLSTFPEGRYFFVLFSSGTPICISQRIDVAVKHERTILLDSKHSENRPGVFYSTGFKTIVRVEGLIKKLQPYPDVNVAREESGDTKLLYSNFAMSRMIRFGTARGIPDFMMVKFANAILNDTCKIEQELYTLMEGETIKPSEDIEGIPMYYYEVIMTMQDNSRGKVFPGGSGADVSGVILVVDASAIGLPVENIIMIDEV